MRESGYYWLNEGDDWVVFFFYSHRNVWQAIGGIYTYVDSDFQEIDEKQITRE